MNEIEIRLGKDLKLTENQDISLFNNDIVTTRNDGAARQKLVNKCKSFPKSLFYNDLWGGLYQSMVAKNIDSDLISMAENAGRNEFLDEPEVEKIISFVVDPRPEIGQLITNVSVKFRGQDDIVNIRTTESYRLY